MALAEDFSRIVGSLPPDWTHLELDLRIFDEERYVEAATILVQINAQPYSEAEWHWRINVAHGFGHGAAPETVAWVLSMLDVQLRPDGDGTRVEVFHEGRGIAGDPRGDLQHWDDALGRLAGGVTGRG